ncbi:MAG TPA: hypothetical protein DCM02_01810 [Flavobacterium sp.]|nr:hypothetical protein [Flavobacterium sp.]
MKNRIKNYSLVLTLSLFCFQCQSKIVNKVTLEGKNFLDMPFEQVDFDNENVYYEIACQEQDLNKDGLKDIILFLDFSESFHENSSIDDKRKKSTLICLQESSGDYRVTAHNLTFLYFFESSIVACSEGVFTITTEGDRYDNHTYTMEFTYKDDGFYMTKKIVQSEFQDEPLENIQINDKSVPLKDFNLYNYFNKYMLERDARQKKMYPDG